MYVMKPSTLSSRARLQTASCAASAAFLFVCLKLICCADLKSTTESYLCVSTDRPVRFGGKTHAR